MLSLILYSYSKENQIKGRQRYVETIHVIDSLIELWSNNYFFLLWASHLLQVLAFNNIKNSYKNDLQVLGCIKKQKNFKNGKSYQVAVGKAH